MRDTSYYLLACIACATWAFIALSILDKSYGRIDLVQQEEVHYYF